MTSNFPETDNFGLTRVGEGESIAKDGYAVTDGNVVSLDRILKALSDHDHSGVSRLANPTEAPDVMLGTAGGTLPAGQTYYYLYSFEDQYGLETAASPEVSITTPPPLGVPPAPALQAEDTGGALVAGVYRYVLAARTSGGGLTTTSPVAAVQVIDGTTNRILIALPALPAGATTLVIFRSRPGQSQYYYWTESTTSDDLYDDGSIAEDITVLAPAYNTTSGTNTVTVTLPGGAVPTGVARWRLYRTSDPGLYNGLNLVHLVTEGVTEEATTPGPTWIDDGSELLAGQPRRVSGTIATPPTIGASAALAIVTSETARLAQERSWSAFAPGTLVIGKTYAADPNLFHLDTGAARNQLIVPRWMHAYYQDAPTVDPDGAQVGFELVGTAYNYIDTNLPAGPTALGFGGASWVGPAHRDVTIESEDTPQLSVARQVADALAAGGSKAGRISAQNEFIEFAFDGAAAAGFTPARPYLQADTVYYVKIRLRAEGSSTPPTNDLRLTITDTQTSTVLVTQDYTVLPLASSSSTYYDILARITTPAAASTNPNPITVRVQKLLATAASYLVDRVVANPMPWAIGGDTTPVTLRATLVDSPNFALPSVAFATGKRFVVPPKVLVREGIETSASIPFHTSDAASASWSVSSDQSWCVPSPASGTGISGTITAAVDTTGFTAGSRNVATLTLTASGYADATVEVVALMQPTVLGGNASVLIRYVNG